MATSGSTDWTLTADGIVRGMFRLLGKIDYIADTTYFNNALDALNGIQRSWQAEGLYLFKTRDITVFLENDKKYYSIGPSGDYAAVEPTKTEISTAAASGALTIEVDSITGISASDTIGVEVDDGTIHWTTVNGAPSGTTVTLTAALDDDAAVDNHVYAYTSKPARPVNIKSARFVLSDDTEMPLWVCSREEYMSVQDKAESGDCTMVYPDMRTTNIRIYAWPTCDDVKCRIVVTADIPPDDFDAAANNADFPPEWIRALKLNLAVEFAPELNTEPPAAVVVLAREAKAAIAASDIEVSSVTFGIDQDNY